MAEKFKENKGERQRKVKDPAAGGGRRLGAGAASEVGSGAHHFTTLWSNSGD